MTATLPNISPPTHVLGAGGARQLPVRLAPVPQEAFDSWLEHYAARLQTRLLDLVTASVVGVPGSGGL